METKLRLACVLGGLMISSSALLAIGCGSDPAKGPDAAGGGEAAGGGASSSAAGETGVSDAGGAPSGSGGTSTGARPNIDPGGATGPGGPGGPDQPGAGGSGQDSPDFDGVDLADVPDTAPSGCVGGFDAKSGTLSIKLDDASSIVRLAVHAGVVQANGVDCQSKAGDPAKADAVVTLEISGGAEDDVVYLDLSDEPFAGCFSQNGRVSVELGAGKDRVTVLGTSEADVFHAGTDKDKLLLDVNADDRADVSIGALPALVLSTGAKADEIRADGVALKIAPAALPLALYGGGAGDKLVGGAMADQLFGGIGNDWFDAGAAPAGADTFDGGDGTDTIDFSARTAPLIVTLGAGADDGEAGEDADVTASVEDLYGGQAKNEITGSGESNTIWGGPADDTLLGGGGDDTLVGGKGDDTLKGEAGNDYLYGEDGDDDLDGGTDDDLLDGGAGKNALNGGPGDGDICIVAKTDKASACEL